jgi:beta-lactam-binding protein with PASTA domain
VIWWSKRNEEPIQPKKGKTVMPKSIVVIVSPKGETTIQTKGYVGSECQQASKWLEQALGVITSDQKTSEFYQSNEAQQQIQQ